MPCPHWRQTRTRLYGLHDMSSGIYCLSWGGIDVFAVRYNVISFPLTPYFYRITLVHSFPELMERQIMDSAPISEPSNVLFRYHITSFIPSS